MIRTYDESIKFINNSIDKFEPLQEILDRELSFIELKELLAQFKKENPETVNLLYQLNIGFGIINNPRRDLEGNIYNKVNIIINLA